MTNDETTRRRFLEGSAGAGAGHVALSTFSARSFADVVGANDRVQIGVIGTGGRASQLMDHLIPKPRDPVQGGIPQWKTKPVDGADLVAVADVYEPHRNQAAARAGPNTAKFHDYRKLLDQKDVAGRDHRGPRPLAQTNAPRCGRGGKGRLPRETGDPHARRRSRGDPGRGEERPDRADRYPTTQLASLRPGQTNRRLGRPGRRAACGSLLVHELRRERSQ